MRDFYRVVLWVGIIGLLLAAMVGGSLMMEREEQRRRVRRLPDGTVLTLSKVTFGKKHEFKRLRLQWAFPPWFIVDNSMTTDTDTLIVWFAYCAPASATPRDVPLECDVLDEHGCHFPSLPLGFFSSLHMPGEVGIESVELRGFPRRSERFRLRLYEWRRNTQRRKTLTEFIVPVPAAARKVFPQWQPEPLPATKHAGDLSVTLTGLSWELGSNEWVMLSARPQFQFAQNGEPTREWEESGITFADATGNSCYEVGLCRYEPAWKLRARFFRTDNARFSPDETWITKVPVPKPNTAKVLSGSRTIQGVKVELLAIGGKGKVSYSHRKAKGIHEEESTHSEEEGIKFAVNMTTRKGAVITTVKAASPHVAVRAYGLTENHHITLQATDERGRRVQVVAHVLSSHSDGERHYWFLKPSPNAQTLRLTFAVHKSRTVEFFVQPPGERWWRAAQHRVRARKFWEKKQFEKALAELSKAIALNPSDPEVWRERGELFANLKQWDKAVDDYRRTFAALLTRFRKTGDTDALYDAVWVGVAVPKAIADPNELVRLANKLVTTPSRTGCRNPHSALGAVLYRARRLKAAVQALNKAVRATKGGAEWDWLFLAMAHRRLGQTAQARRWFDKTARRMKQDSLCSRCRLELLLLQREAEGLLRSR